jgi:hypothetical protein
MYESGHRSVHYRYFAIAILFASIYFAFSPDEPGALTLPTFGHAFIASLQIQSTIGFAAPTEGHWAKNGGLIAAIVTQGLLTILFNIFLLGTLFARMSSAKNRAVTVRVSSVAVLRDNDGVGYPFLEFRIGEIRKHQLMNLRVSAFLFCHKGEKLFHRERLSLEPAEGIFLAVPTEVRHTLNESSPIWRLLRRDAPGVMSSFDCPVCGDSFDSRSSLTKHMTFLADSNGDLKHKEALGILRTHPFPSLESLSSMMRSFTEYWEVIVLVEGTEPITGSPIQVRHSFLSRDVRIGVKFHKCWSIEVGESSKKIVVDFDLFDRIISDDATAIS